jgi:hypothetical protein
VQAQIKRIQHTALPRTSTTPLPKQNFEVESPKLSFDVARAEAGRCVTKVLINDEEMKLSCSTYGSDKKFMQNFHGHTFLEVLGSIALRRKGSVKARSENVARFHVALLSFMQVLNKHLCFIKGT